MSLLPLAARQPAAPGAGGGPQPRFGSPGPLLPQPLRRQRQQQASRRPDAPEGSGIVVGDGTLIVTAAHVLGSSTDVRVRTRDGLVVAGKLFARSPATDIALIKIDRPLEPALLRDEPLIVRERVCAFGNAFGLDLTLTCGVVSGLNKTGTGFNAIEDFAQTDAAVNPGMSGGALFDQQGRVVGMLSAIFTKTSDANIGVNFAVSVPLLKRVIADLASTKRLRRVSTGMLLVRNMGRRGTGRLGARVRRVRPTGAAADAGLKEGDTIVMAEANVSGRLVLRRIKSPSDWVSFTHTLPLPSSVTATVIRDGKEIKRTLNVAAGR